MCVPVSVWCSGHKNVTKMYLSRTKSQYCVRMSTNLDHSHVLSIFIIKCAKIRIQVCNLRVYDDISM